MYDVITIGSATRDVFLVSDQFKAIKTSLFETGMAECMSLGSKIELKDQVLTTGGGGTNSAVTFASLGLRTACICKVGEDAPGRDVLETLRLDGVKTTFVKQVQRGQTGYSTILTMKNGERTVLVHRGVSSKFTRADIPWKKLNAKWIYLTSLGGNFALSAEIIKKAKKNGCKIAWNPGTGELKKGMRAFKETLKFVDVFNINKEEAELLTKKTEAKEMLTKLQRENGITLITDGVKGAYAHCCNKLYKINTTRVNAVSQTGAGDAFGSAFVSALMLDHKIEEALSIGVLNAESVIQSFGAKIGILTKFPSKTALKKLKVTQIKM
jgi:ribokinase